MTRSAKFLVFAALLALMVSIAPAQPLPRAPEKADAAKATELVVERTNAYRKEKKLEPVQVDKHLTAAAEYFAKFMADSGQYGHEADGKKPAERAADHGYDYCMVLENIAYQYSSDGYDTEPLAEQFMQGWINSRGHRENLENPHVVHIGVAIVRDEVGRYYAVQKFGRPEEMMLTFSIMNEAGVEVAYTLDEEKFTLAPRHGRKHTMCITPKLRFTWEGARELEPKDGTQLTVRRNPRGQFVVNTK
jgi:uncharacterized protein YkwD